MNSQLKVTIAIPTYLAGEHLVPVLRSIYEQDAFRRVERVLLILDGGTLKQSIFSRIKNKKLQMIKKNTRKGQSARIDDIFRVAHSELLILTNDDIILKKNAVSLLLRTFEQRHADLICAKLEPLKEKTLFEKTVSIGSLLKNYMLTKNATKPSYLFCNGRLLGLSKRFYKSLHIPHSVINNDAFIYVSAIENNRSVVYVDQTLAKYRNPMSVHEYLAQSLKFRNSNKELAPHFSDESMEISYNSPMKFTEIIAVIWRMLKWAPMLTSLYLCLQIWMHVYTITGAEPINIVEPGIWTTDVSTKYVENYE